MFHDSCLYLIQYLILFSYQLCEKWDKARFTCPFRFAIWNFSMKAVMKSTWNPYFTPSNLVPYLSKFHKLGINGKRTWSTSSLMLGTWPENAWIFVEKSLKSAGTPMLHCWIFQNISKSWNSHARQILQCFKNSNHMFLTGPCSIWSYMTLITHMLILQIPIMTQSGHIQIW